MFSIAARLKVVSLGANAAKLAAPAMGMGTSIDPTIPKRPANAYALFIQDKYAAEQSRNAKAPCFEILPKLAGQWKQLSDAGKKPYAEKAAKLKAAYDGQITDVQRKILAVESKKKSAELAHRRLKQTLNKPKLLPGSGYVFFVQEKYASLPAAQRKSVTAAMKTIAAQWRELADKDKAPYVSRAAKNKAKNRETLDTWKQALIRSGHQDDLAALNARRK